MKFRILVMGLLMFFIGIQIGFTNTIYSRPGKSKNVTDTFNQTLLGKNVFVFDPYMDMQEIQILIDSLHTLQTAKNSEFSGNRYALLFKPGTYKLNVRVGYYMHVMGLGKSPEDVIIEGSVSSVSLKDGVRTGHVLTNFWRAAENLKIIPTVDSTNIWAVSQAAPLRRVHIKGNLKLFDGASSGGFMADCKIDGTVFSGSQQQWLTRNSIFKKWEGGVWNMMYVGVVNAPEEHWPEKPVTTINETPLVREKPYWTYSNGKFILKMPALKENSTGVDWQNKNSGEKSISINKFYIARPNIDDARSINRELKSGRHILFTPGIYSLDESLKVIRPGTVIMGIGMPTLVPAKGNKAIEVSDTENATISGLLIDAGIVHSEILMQVGEPGSKKKHEANPTFLFDLFFRVGGPHEGSASQCLLINSNDVIVDHVWLWRADHGAGVGWDKNKCANGLIVNGNQVTIYGLFNEHFQEYQTLWNGEGGSLYFYQSEMPYDPPTAWAWKHGEVNGYASYKVAGHVKSHNAWGVGIYNVFYNAPVIVDQAIETPEPLENNIHHKVIFWLNGNKESIVRSVINGKGGSASSSNRKVALE
ncbi:MAG: coagulation factor 5/8 type domain-containing protein [Prolixibacteraceae bacterium]|jgi:hypothetical protein|nr:coagulation factor 5/8 type domain-containing protein [Prolixibacteraceae bacterium]